MPGNTHQQGILTSAPDQGAIGEGEVVIASSGHQQIAVREQVQIGDPGLVAAAVRFGQQFPVQSTRGPIEPGDEQHRVATAQYREDVAQQTGPLFERTTSYHAVAVQCDGTGRKVVAGVPDGLLPLYLSIGVHQQHIDIVILRSTLAGAAQVGPGPGDGGLMEHAGDRDGVVVR